MHRVFLRIFICSFFLMTFVNKGETCTVNGYGNRVDMVPCPEVINILKNQGYGTILQASYSIGRNRSLEMLVLQAKEYQARYMNFGGNYLFDKSDRAVDFGINTSKDLLVRVETVRKFTLRHK